MGCVALFIPGGANGLNRIAWLYPYLVLGYLVSKRRAQLRRFDGPVTVVSALAFGALSAANARILPAQFATGTAGAVAACGIFRFLPAAASRVLAPLGRRTLGIYGAQMVVFPFLVVGQGWAGAFASWAIVLAVSTAVALLLDRFARDARGLPRTVAAQGPQLVTSERRRTPSWTGSFFVR